MFKSLISHVFLPTIKLYPILVGLVNDLPVCSKESAFLSKKFRVRHVIPLTNIFLLVKQFKCC